ncbi:alpha/beta fold hydrolase [Patulibacter sp.]|uniref:alpha/beta fold hydrolase n=1 Tax=Patulibacter sp. TaxID=1912859 RepID=UPI00271F76B1|nr:alpha/beta hydrolase [Patulibacter sp.]MDO9410312.1 alpha/beta hydrolase [Patulibacter sp.]
MVSPTTPLLLIGGAGLPAWIWDDVRAALPRTRPTAVAERPDPSAPRTLEAYAAAALDGAPWRHFVLVGHSIGGVIAGAVVARTPDRVRGVVGIAASFPEPGRSFFGALPFPQRLVVPAITRVAGTRPPDRMLRGGYARDLPAPVVDRLVDDFAPESQELYRDPVPPVSWPPRTGYLRTTADRDMPRAAQDRYATTLEAERVEELATGHLPMLQDPEGTAAAIERLLA